VEADVGAGHQVVLQVGVEDAAEDELDVVAFAQVLDVSRRPVLRLSRMMTESPRASRASARCEPMKPAPL
jgi:hypothetical protein